MRHFIVLVVLVLLAGCSPSTAPQWSDKPLSAGEEKALAAAAKVYQQNKIRILDEWGTERQVVGAQMAVVPCKCDMHEGHEEHATHPDGHLVTLVTRAQIEPKKEYTQPTVTIGENLYFYKTIYIATVDDKTLTMQKTVAREDADQRNGEPVEPALLQSISAAAGGTLQESSILLP
ncbi:MAG: hypothetical protein C4531_00225 [Desulfurivibrio sp.]|nr:MAG: hypothetical protein C4531_00225 [Desulfurivibrio sp.]